MVRTGTHGIQFFFYKFGTYFDIITYIFRVLRYILFLLSIIPLFYLLLSINPALNGHSQTHGIISRDTSVRFGERSNSLRGDKRLVLNLGRL